MQSKFHLFNLVLNYECCITVSVFTTCSDIGLSKEGSTKVIVYLLFFHCFFLSKVQARQGEEIAVNPDQFQGPT